MASVRPVAWAILGLLTASGCGDPIAPPEYAGAPRLMIRGKYVGPGPPDQEPHGFARAGLFWNPGGTGPFGAFSELLEQPSNGWDSPIPGRIEWPIFDEPLPQHLTSAAGAQYGLGLPYVYVDGDEDRRYDPGETVFSSPPVAVLFSASGLSAPDSPTGRAIPPGWHLLMRPLGCPEPPPPAAEGECGVPVGAPCRQDVECGPGVCLLTEPFDWQDGTCAVPEPSASGCRPANAALLRNPTDRTRGWWVAACQTSDDCRGEPYRCDYSIGGCLPTGYLISYLASRLEPAPICAP